jgi:hypothetical protein
MRSTEAIRHAFCAMYEREEQALQNGGHSDVSDCGGAETWVAATVRSEGR